MDLSLLAAAEAFSECAFLYRSTEGNHQQSDRSKIEKKFESSVDPSWNIGRSFISNSTKYEDDDDGIWDRSVTPYRIGTKDFGLLGGLDHSLGLLGRELLSSSSQSRDLINVISLLLESNFISSALWSSIGASKQAVDSCMMTMSTFHLRIRFPICFINLGMSAIQNQIKRIPYRRYSDELSDSRSINDESKSSNVASSAKQVATTCLCLASVLHSFELTIRRGLMQFWPTCPYDELQWIIRQYSRPVDQIDDDQMIRELHKIGQNLFFTKSVVPDATPIRKTRVKKKLLQSNEYSTQETQLNLEEVISNVLVTVSDCCSNKNGLDCISSTVKKMIEQLKVLSDISRRHKYMTDQKVIRPKIDSLELPSADLVRTASSLLITFVAIELAQFNSVPLFKALTSFAIDVLDKLGQFQPIGSNSVLINSIRNWVIAVKTRHVRCSWIYRFRRLQKQYPSDTFIPSSSSIFSKIEDTAEFILRSHKSIDSESIIPSDLWSLIYLEPQTNGTKRRIRCWRYFGQDIVTATQTEETGRRIKKVDQKKKKSSNWDGQWVSICTEWEENSIFEELSGYLEKLKQKNIASVQNIDDEARDWWKQR